MEIAVILETMGLWCQLELDKRAKPASVTPGKRCSWNMYAGELAPRENLDSMLGSVTGDFRCPRPV